MTKQSDELAIQRSCTLASSLEPERVGGWWLGRLGRSMSFFARARDPMVSEIFESIRTPASADGKISFQEMQNYIAQQFIALQGAPDASEEAQSIGKRGAHLCFRAAGRTPIDRLTYGEFERW